ncbi:MAG: bacteriohemerythrin [Pseudomonadota bacterium]|nr:bacteriohemerythrin [Pseudomonadota bacterium]
MPIMTWDASLDVGVETMNDEHKQILDLMNEIHDRAAAGETGPAMTGLVERLAQVTIDHFRDEEAYMASIDYKGLASHTLIHADLLKKYTAHADAIRANGGQVPSDFLMFLKLWLTAHIKGIDMKYSPTVPLKMAG